MEATTATSTTIRRAIAAAAAALLLLAACGDDGDAGSGDPTGSEDTGTDDGSGGSGDSGGGGESTGGGGTGSGTLEIDGETIELSARCFLESQPSAGGGGNILFNAQGQGTNAAGEDVLLDVSRYDEESQFAGDDFSVDIGDVFAGEAVSLDGRADVGAITVDGSTLSATDQPLLNTDDGSTVTISFELDC